MWQGVVARRSARDRILWEMHALVEGTQGLAAFVGAVLHEFNVPPAMAAQLGPQIAGELPRAYADAEMSEVLAVFERVIPIRWESDAVAVPPTVQREVRAAILAALAATDKTTTPRQLSAQLQPTLERLLGPYVPPPLLAHIPDRVNQTLVSSLWSARDATKQRDLCDWMLADLEGAGLGSFQG